MTPEAARRVVVIGAGVVGVNVALALRRRDVAVTVLDARGPGLGTSYGNAGCIAVAEISPVSMPGLVWQVPPHAARSARAAGDPGALSAALGAVAVAVLARRHAVAGRGGGARARRAGRPRLDGLGRGDRRGPDRRSGDAQRRVVRL
ncbi:MAG: FAD-dependent oxidoreductase [Pseudomonadota bacterium]